LSDGGGKVVVVMKRKRENTKKRFLYRLDLSLRTLSLVSIHMNRLQIDEVSDSPSSAMLSPIMEHPPSVRMSQQVSSGDEETVDKPGSSSYRMLYYDGSFQQPAASSTILEATAKEEAEGGSSSDSMEKSTPPDSAPQDDLEENKKKNLMNFQSSARLTLLTLPDESKSANLVQSKKLAFSLRTLLNKSNKINMNMLDQFLLTIDINAKDVETNKTLFEHAVETNDVMLAKWLYRKGAKMSQLASQHNLSYVNLAVSKKAYKIVEFLVVMNKSTVNSRDGTGSSPIHVASKINDIDMVCRLVEWGSLINCQDNSGKTPIMIAAMKGFREMAELLLELGGDLNVQDHKGYTAVIHAEQNDHFQLMDRLIELGGNKGLAKSSGKSIKFGVIPMKPLYKAKEGTLGRLGKYRK
jgi:Ankyrin repeats (3 copies)